MSLEVLVIEHEHPDDLPVYDAAIRAAFPDAVIRLATNEQEALGLCASADVIAGKAHDIPASVIAAAPRLRFIQAFTTGVDHLRTVGLPPHVAVSNARGIHGPQMAELAIMHMIALLRDFPAMLANQREAKWLRWPQRLLTGKTAVLLGVGAISEAVATRLSALGMTVIGVSGAPRPAPGFARVEPRERMRETAALADFLIVLAPLTPQNHHLVNAALLGVLKPEAFVINLARGPCVDEPALIAALQEKRIAGAGLDVFEEEPPAPDNPLWTMPNVTMTPRIGGMSDMYAHQVAPLFIENLKRFAASGASDLVNRIEV